ncbi:unnamed protein product [Pleuronectes platessa]|uniref:Coiled-coil domain containing 157 n=1 Tax=Pleuronectes platessa TaxID=8262 RepID=A0A9N7YVQ8_PLEPL|nr:unnamed protein product [Pleuronectes platessa]
MSQFLGRQDCIESLRGDLVDLQGAILDVFSWTGPLRVPSWKFPDKLSCNLDRSALLGQYDFVEGESEFNQHSHIVLLELVIDRLLLLLQSSSSYVEQLRCSPRREQTQQKGGLSVGLVVRNYWSNLVDFASLTVRSRSDSCRHCSSAWSSSSFFEFLLQNHAPSSPSHNTPCCPKTDSRSVGCQTVESSLSPCDACHQVQSTLRKTGYALVELFQSEGLPSSLQPLLAAVEDTLQLGHMTTGDVAQWANEQLRDLRRLEKHLQDVRATVHPLRHRLAAAETERDKFRTQLERARKDFKQETEKCQATIVQLEFSLSKAQRSMKETETKLQEEKQQLKRETLSQEDALQALECEKIALQEKVKSLHLEEEACCKLQNRIQQLESDISETQVLLDKEKAKYHSACRQQESMQAKQKSLLERVDDLDEECEELQRQLGDEEGRQNHLHNELQQMSEEKEQLQAQLTQQQVLCFDLQKEKETVETNMGELEKSVVELKEHVQVLLEREKLLVSFPELSAQVQAQPQSTGNVLLDMEKQMQANCVRIKVLEQENATLHSSLDKLRERAHFVSRAQQCSTAGTQ